MQKPVYLSVLGISIVVAAVSLGMTMTRYLSLRAYAPKAAARPAAADAERVAPAQPPEKWTNLFAPPQGMNIPSRLPTANAKSVSLAPRTAFILVGTIVSSSPAARRAILWANGMKEPKAFRETEEVEPGAFLSSVERDKVWITRGKEREKLEILPVGSRTRPTATAAPIVAPPVASVSPLPVTSPGVPSRPGTATSPRPTPERTQAVAAPKASSGDEDEESFGPQERRRRSRRNLR